MKRKLILLLLAFVLLVSACSTDKTPEKTGDSTEKKSVTIITPYISSVTTKQMADKMEELMKNRNWDVQVVDTKNDMAQLASRMEDVISAKTDAIVLVSTDPNQVIDQIGLASKANIPVLGCDSGFVDGMVLNATSDNYAMGEQLTNWIFDAIDDSGKVIAFTHRPHPGVIKRSEAFDAIRKDKSNIELIVEQHVNVPGPIEDARKSMESLLLSNPEKGSISAVWCAWDEPAIGVAQAIQAAGRDEIIVGGVDGNSQAVTMIKDGSPIKVTIGQNFEGMAEIVDSELAKIFAGEDSQQGDVYAPAIVITK